MNASKTVGLCALVCAASAHAELSEAPVDSVTPELYALAPVDYSLASAVTAVQRVHVRHRWSGPFHEALFEGVRIQRLVFGQSRHRDFGKNARLYIQNQDGIGWRIDLGPCFRGTATCAVTATHIDPNSVGGNATSAGFDVRKEVARWGPVRVYGGGTAGVVRYGFDPRNKKYWFPLLGALGEVEYQVAKDMTIGIGRMMLPMSRPLPWPKKRIDLTFITITVIESR